MYIQRKPHPRLTLLKISFLGQRLMYIQPKPHPMLTLLKIASLGQRVILTLLKI